MHITGFTKNDAQRIFLMKRLFMIKKNIAKYSMILSLFCLSVSQIVMFTSCPFHQRINTSMFNSYSPTSPYKPYILELDTGLGGLVYYGAFHNVNPDDPQYSDLEKKWNEFKPTVAYSEGGIWPLMRSRREAIVRYGEQGLLRFLAARDEVPIKSLDQTIIREALYLISFFPEEEIKIYYVLRQAFLNRVLYKKRNCSEYVNTILQDFAHHNAFNHSPSCLAEFNSSVSRLFPNLENWQEIPYAYFHSERLGKFLPRIRIKLNDYRNQHMIKVLTKELRKGERIFSVVGRRHVITQEWALRSVFP